MEKIEGSVTLSDAKIQWHPAFCAAIELELSANRAELDFQREYNLSKKPLQIDLLVIKKLNDVEIEDEIGHIFRRYNIIEFKSPDDGMSIDDFFKTVGYACLYKGLGESVDQIPADQLTVSLVREGKPVELFRDLGKYGFSVEEESDGIYYVKGFFIPAQIVVTKELDSSKHRSLRVLSKNALEEDISGFVEDAQNLTAQGDRENADAVLQVSVLANYELYEEMKRRDSRMCEAMRMLMKDEISEAEKNGRRLGLEDGRRLGLEDGRMAQARETAYKMADRNIPLETISELVNVSAGTVKEWLDQRVVTV